MPPANFNRAANLFCVAIAALYLNCALAQQTTTEPPKPATSVPAEPAQPAQQPLFIVHLVTGTAWQKDKLAHEQPGFKKHSQNLSRMRNEGLLVIGARYKDSAADKGMLLIRAQDMAAVQAQFKDDPMVRDKYFALDIAQFQPFFDGFVARPARPTVASASPLDKLNWLAGCWTGRNGKSEFREHWMRPAGGMMMGMARTLSDGKMSSYEAMRIEFDGNGALVFNAKPSGQAEGTFKLLQQEADGVNFENLAHDFPQRVRYQLKPDGTLHARIEGLRNGKERGIDFSMRRANCE